jgi:hypothetical protein
MLERDSIRSKYQCGSNHTKTQKSSGTPIDIMTRVGNSRQSGPARYNFLPRSHKDTKRRVFILAKATIPFQRRYTSILILRSDGR